MCKGEFVCCYYITFTKKQQLEVVLLRNYKNLEHLSDHELYT